MPRSAAATVDQYLAELPEDRRQVVATLRDLIVRSLPEGYREAVAWGMITYCIPLERYPDTYNRQPLGYVSLAAQKSYFTLYLTTPYSEPGRAEWLAERFRAAGKKLDMGKSCLRFKRLDDLPLPAIEELIAATPPERLIEIHEAARGSAGRG